MSEELDEKTLALFSEYYDGELTKESALALERRFDSEPALREQYQEFEKELKLLSSVGSTESPHAFGDRVEERIRTRSAGRFFGRRAFGDRVPLELLAILGAILASLAYGAMRCSTTGSVKINRDTAPEIHQSAPDVVPRP